MKKRKVSLAVIKRMPKYYRHLSDLLKNDVDRISSKELSNKIGFTASQIRQDFNNFGGFGQQGYGYNVRDLYSETGNILGLNRRYSIVIVGAGNIGQAIANYTRFDKLGFEVKAVFDSDERVIGKEIRGQKVLNVNELDGYLKENKIDIGVVATPTSVAQDTVDKMVSNGIAGIWNFAPVDVNVPDNVAIENVHLSDSLLTLVYLMNDIEK